MNIEILILIFMYFTFNNINALPIKRELNESSVNDLKFNNDDDDDDDDGEIDLTELGNIVYGLPSEETGKRVAMWREEDNENPEELGEYAQGDILIPPISLRSGMRSKRFRWPNAKVPYMISPVFSPPQHSLIMEAMNDIEKYTCIKFFPRTGENSYIRFQSANSGCWSPVGYMGSRVDINLQRPGCVTKKGTVLHEILHSLGFIHEQSRDDRDENVYIQRENIKPGSEANFGKYSRRITNNFGKPYDYGSVMHYSSHAFSANGKPTIVPRNKNIIFQNNNNRIMGQRNGLSKIDIEKLNAMYDCYNEVDFN